MNRLIVKLLFIVLAAVIPVFAGEPPAGTAIIHPGDGAVMVYVPAGEFTMGMDKPDAEKLAALLGYKDYHIIAAEEWFPKRKVFVPGFFIDKYETTVGQWDAFVKATGHVSKDSKLPEKKVEFPELYPAVSVYWAEAAKYANWAHKSLPYEAQWEKAARGTDGRWFPWGNEKPTPELGVFVDLNNPKNKNEPTHTQMVGSKPKGASPYGCMDMAGNVYEWTAEWFEPYPNNPEGDRLFSYTGHTNGVLRGGSFYHADHAYCAAKRFGFKPDETYYHVGFRCVWQPPEGYFESDDFKAAQAKVAAREAEMAAKRPK